MHVFTGLITLALIVLVPGGLVGAACYVLQRFVVRNKSTKLDGVELTALPGLPLSSRNIIDTLQKGN